MRRLVMLLVAGAAGMIAVLPADTASAADASVTPTSAPAGAQVTVQGDCGPAEPGDTVVIVFRQGTLFDPIADESLPDNGQFSVVVTVPQAIDNNVIQPGAAIIEVICDVLPPPAAVLLSFTVLGDPGEPPPETPPPPESPLPPEPVATDPSFTG
jgi:hypothetical protein